MRVVLLQSAVACRFQIFPFGIKIDSKHPKSDLCIVSKRLCEVVI